MQEKELTADKCYEILKDYKVPEIVIKHSEGVAKVALFLGKKLREKGIGINLKLLACACLLHDLLKIIEVNDYIQYIPSEEVQKKSQKWNELKKQFNGLNHVKAFQAEFAERFPKITKIVLKHAFFEVDNGFDYWEEKILYYVDKLVEFDKIVKLKERLNALHKRYAKNDSEETKKKVMETDKKIFELEKEIFEAAGICQKDLLKLNDVEFSKAVQEGDGF